jgi:3'-5' exoribonuclease
MFDLVGDRFYQYPAAAKIHHNFLGGLAEHTLGMVAVAEDLVKLYPLLNRDLLVAGVLVHDLGKTEELSGPVTTEYTVEGKLTGHISIEHGWLMEVAEKAGS